MATSGKVMSGAVWVEESVLGKRGVPTGGVHPVIENFDNPGADG